MTTKELQSQLNAARDAEMKRFFEAGNDFCAPWALYQAGHDSLAPLVIGLAEALQMYQTIAEHDCRPYSKQIKIGSDALQKLEAYLNGGNK